MWAQQIGDVRSNRERDLNVVSQTKGKNVSVCICVSDRVPGTCLEDSSVQHADKQTFCVCPQHPAASPWQMVLMPFHLPPQVRLHRDPRRGQRSSRPAGQTLWEHSTSYHHLFWLLSLYQVHLRLRAARCRLLPAL